jgi:hypothetical protein
MSMHSLEKGVLGTLGCAVSLSALAVSSQAYGAADRRDSLVKARDELQSFDLSYARVEDGQNEDRNPPPAKAGHSDAVAEQLAILAAELKSQRELIAQQNAIIARQQLAIDMLTQRQMASSDLSELRGAGMAQGTSPMANETTQSMPNAPVGEAPPADHEIAADVMAVPVAQGVLTPAGATVLESSFEYTRTSRNRLVFRGIELIPGLQLGLIEASDADRDTMVETIAVRHGITSRLEIEARMPALARNDRFQVVQQRNQGIVRQFSLTDYAVGDAEVALRYQINEAKGPDRAIYVANLRLKSNTGRGPFDIGYDEFGIATGLATGSGFWGLQGGVSFLLPSDPVVLYGGTSYLWHIPADVDKLVGGALIGRVDPGDAISANLGFGFALNPRFSFSLGYNHSYIFPTKTEIGGTNQRSTSLHVGSFSVGTSYRLSERQSVNVAFEFGMTSDAPDVSMSLRLPLRF